MGGGRLQETTRDQNNVPKTLVESSNSGTGVSASGYHGAGRFGLGRGFGWKVGSGLTLNLAG